MDKTILFYHFRIQKIYCERFWIIKWFFSANSYKIGWFSRPGWISFLQRYKITAKILVAQVVLWISIHYKVLNDFVDSNNMVFLWFNFGQKWIVKYSHIDLHLSSLILRWLWCFFTTDVLCRIRHIHVMFRSVSISGQQEKVCLYRFTHERLLWEGPYVWTKSMKLSDIAKKSNSFTIVCLRLRVEECRKRHFCVSCEMRQNQRNARCKYVETEPSVNNWIINNNSLLKFKIANSNINKR